MKKALLATFLSALLLPAIAHAAPPAAAAKPRDITTKDGTVYHNATIVGSTADEVMVAYDGGTAYVQINNLPDDLQKDLKYMTPEERAKAEAEKAAEKKAADAKAELDKKAKLESSKHEYVPGTEKSAYPQLNPDFFPDELSSQIAAYNTKAQYNAILAGGPKSPDTDATIKDNVQKMTELHSIYTAYKAFVQNPPAGVDLPAARKAVADQLVKPYDSMPEIAFRAIWGVPDKVDTAKGDDKSVSKTYHYGKSNFTFKDGKYVNPEAHKGTL
ncbi:MAG TPA: hypothetical protein VG733_08410 [Chthoniobacteraceae bacterium]|nr:hypothetical protein [Chthoniobacteraceae bacterium]